MCGAKPTLGKVQAFPLLVVVVFAYSVKTQLSIFAAAKFMPNSWLSSIGRTS